MNEKEYEERLVTVINIFEKKYEPAMLSLVSGIEDVETLGMLMTHLAEKMVAVSMLCNVRLGISKADTLRAIHAGALAVYDEDLAFILSEEILQKFKTK